MYPCFISLECVRLRRDGQLKSAASDLMSLRLLHFVKYAVAKPATLLTEPAIYIVGDFNKKNDVCSRALTVLATLVATVEQNVFGGISTREIKHGVSGVPAAIPNRNDYRSVPLPQATDNASSTGGCFSRS